jgi:hypothetical protein
LPPFPAASPLPLVPLLPYLQFCRRKKIKDKKKIMKFLLVWDKDSYTKSFFVMFPWSPWLFKINWEERGRKLGNC